tara:strand:- start:1911 stop:2801 length:891 start_codon:yes stop_codon:yes gene_type:complete
MSLEDFQRKVQESVAMGFSQFVLTPMLGEVFADPTIEKKFDVLEVNPGVESYLFYSNFILPRETTVRNIATRKKLCEIHISIYGHDRESFCNITRKPSIQYKMLLKNLDLLREICGTEPLGSKLFFSMRTIGGITGENLPSSELTEGIVELCLTYGAKLDVAENYDTWGGVVTPEDVKPINVKLTEGNASYKNGACSLLFGSVQIKADGIVHACACRDVDGSLRLGNANDRPLAELLSFNNSRYRELIETQQKGYFTNNCQACSFYSSIRDGRARRFDTDRKFLPLGHALAILKKT